MVWFAWLVSTALAEDGWIVADAELLRWPDKAWVSASLVRGDEVEVLVRDGANVRVRKGTDFGWLPAANVSAEAIVKVPDFPMELQLPGAGGGMPAGLKLPELTLPGAPAAPK